MDAMKLYRVLTDNSTSGERGEAVAYVIERMFNSCDNGTVAATTVDNLSMIHRTLQQSVTRFCLLWLTHLAHLPEDRYDLRNKASVEVAKEIDLLLAGSGGLEGVRHLPTI